MRCIRAWADGGCRGAAWVLRGAQEVLLHRDEWPRPASVDRLRIGRERWAELSDSQDDPGLAEFMHQLPRHPVGGAMLDAVFGNSPFLTELACRQPALLRDLTVRPIDTVVGDILSTTAALGDAGVDEAALMSGLRRQRRRLALATALADIGGLWALDEVTGTLSRFACTAVRAAVQALLRQAAANGRLDLPDAADPERESGLIVLGMGKLGAGELNYSSDVDLIVFYDDQRAPVRQTDDMARTYIRLVRDLVRIMEQRTADGYVFRTDLRLRPDPGATPLAMSLTGAESYYGSLAQPWERAAMIKARPIAGDPDAAEATLGMLRPFVWRRALDFAAIQDIHAIKRQIHDFRGHGAIGINGHNIKIGRGGIREIEFFAQTQQLVFGGREPALQAPRTVDALAALAASGRISEAVRDDLTLAYGFLRQLEHRLQMVDDRQTHSMPETDTGVDAIGTFLGYHSPDMFRRRLRRELERVEGHYAELFEETPVAPESGPLQFAGAEDDPRTLQTLSEMGFQAPETVASAVRGWLAGRYRATRSERARALLQQLLPTVLHALARTPNPDASVARMDDFLMSLPAGVQPFSLFCANPELLDLMTSILGASPRLANQLARNPSRLEAVLSPGFHEPFPPADRLRADLDGQIALTEGAHEDVLDTVRRWTDEQRFRAGVHILRRSAESADVAAFLSDVAEVGLQVLAWSVERDFARRHGRFDGTAWAIVALGKLGGREMTVRSDLDLIIVYDAQGESDGDKPLTANTYFARLTQRLISAITVRTQSGALYEVDMRLRPSGNAGPLATSLDGFRKYQRESAWTWEHMALTRARVVHGPDALRSAIEGSMHDTLTRLRDPETVRRDVIDMRARIDKEHGTDQSFGVKHRRGGLVDIEFIAQTLQLQHASAYPGILSPNTATALMRLADADLLLESRAVDLLVALRTWARIQAYLRLAVDAHKDVDTAPEALRQSLAKLVLGDAPSATFEAAVARVDALAERTYGHYREIVGEGGPET